MDWNYTTSNIDNYLHIKIHCTWLQHFSADYLNTTDYDFTMITKTVQITYFKLCKPHTNARISTESDLTY